MRAKDLGATLDVHGFVEDGDDTWRRDGPPGAAVHLRKATSIDVAVDGFAPLRIRTDVPDEVVAVVDRLCGATAQAPGTLPVPLDAWNRVLAQLGNLHEAGEQMAAARERAAVAETKVAFLKQQLASGRRRDPGLFGGLFGRG